MFTPDGMKVIIKNKFGEQEIEPKEDVCGCGSGCGCHDDEDYFGTNDQDSMPEGKIMDKK